MRKILIIIWLTALCFLLLGNVHAWDVPSYLRINSGARMWFTAMEGDLIQPDRTKLGFADNLGLKKDNLAWEFFANFRIENIHVVRLKAEPMTVYDQSRNDSYQKYRGFYVGYDLDFYMSPQALFGLNADIGLVSLDTRVKDVVVAGTTYNYQQTGSRAIPSLGLHGTYYPILQGVALRPNVGARFNWWNYESLEAWDGEVTAAVDVPINRLWTWSVSGGYKVWHIKVKRERDTVDMNRSGFFVETAVLF